METVLNKYQIQILNDGLKNNIRIKLAVPNVLDLLDKGLILTDGQSWKLTELGNKIIVNINQSK